MLLLDEDEEDVEDDDEDVDDFEPDDDEESPVDAPLDDLLSEPLLAAGLVLVDEPRLSVR